MATDPDQRIRARTLSSRNMDKEMELLRQYSNRYLPQNHTGGSYRPGQFSSYANTSTAVAATAGAVAATGSSTAPTSSTYNSNYARTNRSNDSVNSHASNSSLGSGLSSSKSPSPSPQSRSTYELNNELSNSSSSSSKNDKHERRRSNLINSNSLHGWDESSLDSTTQEMGEAMRSMVESMQTRVNEQSRLYSDMEERATQDSNFGKPENADRWSMLEVCYWLNSIHFQKYVPNFNSLGIDGSILLHDVDETILGTELGIKKIHLKKCLREITKLKEAVQTRAKITEEEKSRRVEELEKQVTTLHQNNLKLKENIDTTREQLKRLQQTHHSQVRSPRSQLPPTSVSHEPGSNPTTAVKASAQNNESHAPKS